VALSFLKGRKVGTAPRMGGARKGDALTIAKGKVVDGITQQKHYASLAARNEELPRGKGGRATSVWFFRSLDGYWTTIRYGQLPIPMNDKGDFDVFIGDKLDGLQSFYDAVIEAVRKGELDAAISELQQKRSAALLGRTGGGRKKKAA
jgi:hypothetical protein